MRLNSARKQLRMEPTPATPRTHEGTVAHVIDPEQQLMRSVMSCLLWEGEFYESGESIAARIARLVPVCRPDFVAACAYHARTEMNLRHVPLLLVREMARHSEHKKLVAKLLPDVIQRADELAEFVAIYWKDKKQPLSAQVKRGLAKAFNKFSEYDLAKYNRDSTVKLRDVMFLCHVKPSDLPEGSVKYTKEERRNKGAFHKFTEREQLQLRVVEDKLQPADTWENRLSSGQDKATAWNGLLDEQRLGALAFLRNLRNMRDAGIPKAKIESYGMGVNFGRVLPFRFTSAARAVPEFEDILEPMMFKALASAEKLKGKTAILVDNSGSMYGPKVSARSDIDRSDAACALAMLIREIADDCVVIGFGTEADIIPPRRGFALAEAIKAGPGGGTYTDKAVNLARAQGYDRIIVITDEQSHTSLPAPLPKTKAYAINVASYKNGIGYGPWVHIDGWSESVIRFIQQLEKEETQA